MFNRSALAKARLIISPKRANNHPNTTNDRVALTNHFAGLYLANILIAFLLLPTILAAAAAPASASTTPPEDKENNTPPLSSIWRGSSNFSTRRLAQDSTSRATIEEASSPLHGSIFERLSGIFGGLYLNPLSRNDNGQWWRDQDELDVEKLAESRGFSIESHRVTTKDGYILTIHRLVNPFIKAASQVNESSAEKNPLGSPVILQHGIMCASSFFLMNSSPKLDRPRPQPQPQFRANSKLEPGSQTTATYGGEHNGTTKTKTKTTTMTSNSLAIELAQLGYDVWLPNFRGTQYSRAHLRQGQQNSSAYWDFNVDTLIEQDLSAYVHYVLDLTGRRRYMFIGHSLGATVGLGSLLVHRDSRITRQLSCAILMAPVASTQFMRGRLISLFQTATLLSQKPGPFPGATTTFSSFVARTCPHFRQLCLWFASMFVGAKRSSSKSKSKSSYHSSLKAGATPLRWLGRLSSIRQQDSAAVTPLDNIPPSIISNEDYEDDDDDDDSPEEYKNQVNTFRMMMRQSVSVQMLEHIVQVHSSGRLSRFNYGPRTNALRYGNTLAPIYDLSKINESELRLAIVNGQSDAISTPGEVNWISEQVRDKVGHFEQITVPVSPFNHMDLIMSNEAGKFVNKRILEFIQRNECLAPASASA